MKLSIVVPAYNVEKNIGKTLRSLLNQTNQEFELILVDDGSTDNTYRTIKSILSKNNNIKYKIIRTRNGGVSSARNRGLLEATGMYVFFLDGDDYVSENLVEIILNLVEKRNADIICWRYELIRDSNQIIQKNFDMTEISIMEMSGTKVLSDIFDKKIQLCVGSVAYSRELLLNYTLNYTEGCINGEDQEFMYKCLSRAKHIVFINEVLFYYVQRSDSISNSYNLKRLDAVFALERTYEYISELNLMELRKVTKELNYRRIINCYLGIFNDSFRYIKKHNRTRKISVSQLIKDIDKEYPKLNENMIIKFKSYKANDIRIIITTKFFLFSPVVYSYLIDLADMFKKK